MFEIIFLLIATMHSIYFNNDNNRFYSKKFSELTNF